MGLLFVRSLSSAHALLSAPMCRHGRSAPTAPEVTVQITVLNKRALSDPLPGVTRVYVGRPSPLGNPYAIGRDGDRAAVVARYRRWLWDNRSAGGAATPEPPKVLGRYADQDPETLKALNTLRYVQAEQAANRRLAQQVEQMFSESGREPRQVPLPINQYALAAPLPLEVQRYRDYMYRAGVEARRKAQEAQKLAEREGASRQPVLEQLRLFR